VSEPSNRSRGRGRGGGDRDSGRCRWQMLKWGNCKGMKTWPLHYPYIITAGTELKILHSHY